jgi:PKD repeat protein/flagellar hook assembly protein FlgD
MTRFGFQRAALFLVLCIPLLANGHDITVTDPILQAFSITEDEVQLELPSDSDSNPLADAGSSQTVVVGEKVILDGSRSSDLDGNLLTFFWAIVSQPENSTAALSDFKAIKPFFTADQPGTYEIQLTVNDGLSDSLVDTVIISTENSAPVADAGEDFTASVNETVKLDGSLSSDVDGNALTYQWTIISRPEGSVARLTDSSTPSPSLTLDLPGNYVAQLIVNDGQLESVADTVTVSTDNSKPVADAGEDKTVLVNSKVALDGSKSGDVDADALSYRWAVLAKPAASSASIENTNSAQTTITIDTAGVYLIQLIVNDGKADSLVDTLVISTDNSRPQANAGEDKTVFIGAKLALDGKLSFDADAEVLAYQWAILYKPATSNPILSAETTANPEFIADKPGIYIVQLMVFDASMTSVADTMVITVKPVEVKIKISAKSGIAPLQVSLNADTNGGFPPYQFQWDLVGNGTIDDVRQNFVHTYSQSGYYYVILRMRDVKGNAAVASELIRVNSAPVVIASATPDAGPIPLKVAFGAVASDADGIVVLYNWDFDGDDIVDQSSNFVGSAVHTYQQAGRYHAKVTVYDNEGISNSATVVISVGSAPEVTADADNFSGVTPLTVNFSGTAVDQSGQVVLYEWDFDGDKVFDYRSEDTITVQHTYADAGIYNATLRVTDNDGLIAEDSLLISVSGPPVSLPSAYPLVGVAPLKVTFFSNGRDLDGGPEFYEWDFNGDGKMDQRLIASQNTTYTYDLPGTYQASLKVIDDDGLEATTSLTITVKEDEDAGKEVPFIMANSTPVIGNTPLLVQLSGLVAENADTIVKYEWDFESDGVLDFSEDVVQNQLLTETIDVGSYAHQTFADFDGDGDLDMMIGNSNGQITYYLNKGGTGVFDFASQGLTNDGEGNIIDIGSYATPYAYDIDGDKDFDLIVGDSGGWVYILENTGTVQAPDWQNNGRLNLASGDLLDVGSYATPIVYALGNDDDWDLLIGNSNGVIAMIENTGSDDFPAWVDNGDLAGGDGTVIDVGSYAVPWSFDHDGNGVKDLYAGESGGKIVLLENQGSNLAPAWVNQGFLTDTQGGEIDVGSYAVPNVVLTSGSKALDLWVGNSNGQLGWYQSGTNNPKAWNLRSNPFNSIDVGSYAAPALFDYDDNGVMDLVIGDSNGNLQLVLNKSKTAVPIYRWEKLLMDDQGDMIDVDNYASPAFYDLDNDGDKDLLVGNQNGQFIYYENTGSASAHQWTSQGVVMNDEGKPIDIGSYSAPFFVDLDGDGDQDIYAGNSDGQLKIINNTGTVTAPVWELGDLVSDVNGTVIDVGSYAKPLLADFNQDGIMDLFIGAQSGVVFRYQNTGSPFSFAWVLKEKRFGQADIGSYASPIAINLDGDSDLDLLVGDLLGLIYQVKADGIVEHTYSNVGDVTATIQVTDTKGKTSTNTVAIEVLPAGHPVLSLKASSTEGNVPLRVQFEAVANDSNGSISSYEWDFDGDGIYERTGTAREFFTYLEIGLVNPRVRVTDNDGNQAVAALSLKVNMDINISHNALINSELNGTSTINTELQADAKISIKVIDSLGNIVKTLVDEEFRKAGSYRDSWNGLDELDKPVVDGAYYFIVNYSNNGVEGEIDARRTADYKQYSPSRTWPGAFNPYQGIPVTSTYTVNKPSEVSFYFWVRDSSRAGSTIAPVRTLFIREIKTAGTHTEVWDGVDDKGVPVKPGEQYPITLWVYELPENAILVSGSKPVISNLTVTNRVFNPAFNTYSANPNPGVNIQFDLSKNANMEIVVIDEQGVHIDKFMKPDLQAGTNSIVWDGRNFNDELTPPGVFSIQLTAVDDKGNRSISRYAVVTVRY